MQWIIILYIWLYYCATIQVYCLLHLKNTLEFPLVVLFWCDNIGHSEYLAVFIFVWTSHIKLGSRTQPTGKLIGLSICYRSMKLYPELDQSSQNLAVTKTTLYLYHACNGSAVKYALTNSRKDSYLNSSTVIASFF